MARIVVPEERETASADRAREDHVECLRLWDSLLSRVQRLPPSLSHRILRLAVMELMVLLTLTTRMAHYAALGEAPCPSSQ